MDAGFLLMLQDARTAWLDPLAAGYTALGNGGMIWIAVSLAMLCHRNTRPAGMLALCAMIPALAEGRKAPEDRKETVTELDGGNESHFRNYAPKFWEAPCDHAGTIEKLEYTTSVYGDTLNQWANVYVPYGYDASKQYNIIYFFHGTNETQDSFIGDELVKNAIDNMIDMGICEPFIMVCPTYYYNYADRATNHAVFVDEVRNDLMPAVETKYSTYAETADEAGFIASRAHRAYSGYSQGRSVCWQVTYRCMDYAKYFVPMSASSMNNFEPLKCCILHAYPLLSQHFRQDLFY